MLGNYYEIKVSAKTAGGALMSPSTRISEQIQVLIMPELSAYAANSECF